MMTLVARTPFDRDTSLARMVEESFDVIVVDHGSSDATRDVATAQILANRVAGAIDEAITRESERRLAETFQASALPRRLPDLPGIEVRAIYQAAEVGINVGGDWYDFIPFPDGRWGLVLADVSGKGTAAALLMSATRGMLRSLAEACCPRVARSSTSLVGTLC